MDIYLLDWASLLLRWLHVITVIAWIGASFYFVWLDNHLVKPTADDLQAKGVDGELWAVHGGGFYNPQKYMVAPGHLPLSEGATSSGGAGDAALVLLGKLLDLDERLCAVRRALSLQRQSDVDRPARACLGIALAGGMRGAGLSGCGLGGLRHRLPDAGPQA